jgi:hypothetical protein
VTVSAAAGVVAGQADRQATYECVYATAAPLDRSGVDPLLLVLLEAVLGWA